MIIIVSCSPAPRHYPHTQAAAVIKSRRTIATSSDKIIHVSNNSWAVWSAVLTSNMIDQRKLEDGRSSSSLPHRLKRDPLCALMERGRSSERKKHFELSWLNVHVQRLSAIFPVKHRGRLRLISVTVVSGGARASSSHCGHDHVWTKSLVPARLLLLRWVSRGSSAPYCFTGRESGWQEVNLFSAQHIVKVDGKRGLFSGLSPRILSSAISTVVRSKVKQVRLRPHRHSSTCYVLIWRLRTFCIYHPHPHISQEEPVSSSPVVWTGVHTTQTSKEPSQNWTRSDTDSVYISYRNRLHKVENKMKRIFTQRNKMYHMGVIKGHNNSQVSICALKQVRCVCVGVCVCVCVCGQRTKPLGVSELWYSEGLSEWLQLCLQQVELLSKRDDAQTSLRKVVKEVRARLKTWKLTLTFCWTFWCLNQSWSESV